jgi:phosphoglucosamine mutase
MLKEQKPLSELASRISVYPQVLLNLEVSKKPDLTAIPAVRDAIAQCEQELGEKGRVLVRYSGTQQICRVMVEGPDKNQTQSFCNTIAETIKQHIG